MDEIATPNAVFDAGIFEGFTGHSTALAQRTDIHPERNGRSAESRAQLAGNPAAPSGICGPDSGTTPACQQAIWQVTRPLAQGRARRYSAAMEIALYQPDIAGNTGTILRTAACFGVPVHIIEPCGFAFGDRALARAGMDYARAASVTRHTDWDAFARDRAAARVRIVLLTTKGATRLDDFIFYPGDTLLLGSEGAGVPDMVHAAVPARVRIPIHDGFRSLNVAVAAGIALGEALRQTKGFAP
jgi:tRNA (cytidine/uridine-2'-O-)-methyltransferase